MILIIGSGLSCADAVLSVARIWNLAIAALVIIFAAQVALLVSPPVYGRTRRTPVHVTMSWSQLVPRPPSWILPWGLFFGVAATLAWLGNMDWVLVPGCLPATADACSALSMGYPVRWLTASGGIPLIDKAALFRDCAQWALACMSVLYLASFWWLADPGTSEIRSRTQE